jgi:hydrogenase nickel incorporation protein HypA/HybF
MHELGIAQAIVDLVSEHAEEGQRVTRVVVEIGALTAILPDAVRFSFEVASEGTPAEGALFEIISMPGDELKVREMEVL